jgi:hypothetical protein
MNGIILLDIKVKILAKINHHNSKEVTSKGQGV